MEEILLKQLSAESLSQRSLWAVPGWDGAGARAQLLGWSGQEQPPELGPELGKCGFHLILMLPLKL